MISDDERDKRERFYYDSFNHLTTLYHHPPTHSEMIMYMALILKEDPIELAIAIYKIERMKERNETQRFRGPDMVHDERQEVVQEAWL